jgi:hypothetical protein
LLRHHYHGLGCESSVAMVEEIFERGAKKIDDKNVVEAFLAKIVDIRDASYMALVRVSGSCFMVGRLTATNKNFVRSVLISQLWCITFPGFLCV